ncbi:MAG: 50S ribosomal protein L6 [Armatimonadetes bacterium]|nr:50S ribosomal protein L6 [Armatimonadota bacterium]
MSRVGRRPIPIPPGVKVTVEAGNVVRVASGKKELVFTAHPDITVRVEDGQVMVERPSDRKFHRQLHGTTRALLANMIQGVAQGFEKVLELHGLGYRADMRGKSLVMQLGFAHEVVYTPTHDVEISVEGQRPILIRVRGSDKQQVGQVAAEIRRLRPVEPYKGKGLRYQGEKVRLKPGKAGRAAK